jgi:4-amino-4-deoxy-L-arabinose transferase-like glycosyltransferase
MDKYILYLKNNQLIILIGLSLFFFIGLGNVHLFDWDEVNFAESAREMLETQNYLSVQINYIPFWEKPPLFFWMQAISMKIFGVNEFAARFPNAIFGVIYLVTLYHIGFRLMKDTSFGWLWSLMYFGSILPHLYFKSGIIDPVFNYFIFMSVYYVYKVFEDDEISSKSALIAGLFSGLSFLTKGPVGLLLVICTTGLVSIWLLLSNSKNVEESAFNNIVKTAIRFLRDSRVWQAILMFTLGFSSLIVIWLGAEVYFHGFDILMKFVKYQIELFTTPVAGHGQPFYYHFVVVFLGCFPISVFGLPYLIPGKDQLGNHLKIWMIALFWVVMIIFSISTTKIVHYSSMTYLPLSFLAAKYIYEVVLAKRAISRFVFWTYTFLGFIWTSLFITFFYLINHIDLLRPYINDKMALSALAISNSWTGYEPMIGIFFGIGFVLSLYFWIQKRMVYVITTISLSIASTLLMTLIWVLPGIERYSQGPAIDFYKSLENQDVYVETIGFKSYAQYFYKKIKPGDSAQSKDKSWLLDGKIDKDVYFVTKVNHTEIDGRPDIQKLKCEGSFCFYVRRKK